VKLALKVDVDTYRGTRDGVPRLVEALKRHGAGATFLFSLGPDHTGRAIKRIFRPGFMRKVSRTSVLRHYGITTLLYGTLLRSPDIGQRCADVMLRVREEGFDVGIHCWDHVKWQDGLASADAVWVEREMRRAYDRFTAIFADPPRVHGAAGWQTNRYALRLTQRLGFDYCSDTRGEFPFIPIYDAEVVACPQLPTTLPTLDELLGRDGLDADNVHERVLALSADPPPSGHVFTLHAELEGMRLLPALERLLEGWHALGYEIVPLRAIAEDLQPKVLPHHVVVAAEIPGRSGTVAVQGPPFLADAGPFAPEVASQR
jgi:peptidoglycan/xylan/chitin deacetylase (PgdA/CDA1 family)